ncbi:hypothetical protein M0805_001820 [Coniferiporia weirii]|nr:hypothetical protein M0805_001820 [Coniferiporia weirii]
MSSPPAKSLELREEDGGKTKVPRWLPVSLLAVTTVALAVPAVLLWRQKRSLGLQSQPIIGKKHSSTPPVRRRGGTGWGTISPRPQAESVSGPSTASSSSSVSPPPPRRATPRAKLTSVGVAPSRSPSAPKLANMKSESPDASGSLLDSPLMSLGALGLATAAVGIAATLGVWGVQRSMGVDNVDQFAARMRHLLLTHMPTLSSRIYRTAEDPDTSLLSDGPERAGEPGSGEVEGWAWEAAEDRLTSAFERGGVREWAERALVELEAEEKVERSRRGL